MTPSEKAKQYAEDNGFNIVKTGKHYTVTDARNGDQFERAGYEAIYNEMARLRVGRGLKVSDVVTITHGPLVSAKPLDGVPVTLVSEYSAQDAACEAELQSVTEKMVPVTATGEHLDKLAFDSASVKLVADLDLSNPIHVPDYYKPPALYVQQFGRAIRPRQAWRVRTVEHGLYSSCASYADAVKDLRRLFQRYGKNKPAACIVWDY